MTRQVQFNRGDQAGSDAGRGYGAGRVTRPETSTAQRREAPPCDWRENMITRLLGAQVGPSSR